MHEQKTTTFAVERKREQYRKIRSWVRAVGGLFFFGCLLAFGVMSIITPSN